jgi:hypothetical protein
VPKIAYIQKTFSADRLSTLDTANDIITDYANQGYILTLRQLYYQFVARGLIENSERSYKNLGGLIADGRMTGYLDWDGIEDRGRGVKPWLIEEDEQAVFHEIERNFALDKWSRQHVYVEVWVEKEALASVVERPCSRWSVPYMSCKGYLSVSEAWRAGQRFEQALDMGHECVLIHLGDHDPSGIDMTRDNDDRIALFAGQRIDVRRIALNMDQVQRYNPPPNPAKITDSRAVEYIRKHGHTSWELDALQPQVLDALIDSEIQTLIDPGIWDETMDEQRERREVLKRFYTHFDQVRDFAAGLDA